MRPHLRRLAGALAVLGVLPVALPGGGIDAAGAAQDEPVVLGPLVEQDVWVDASDGFAIALRMSGTVTQPTVVMRFGGAVDRAELSEGLEDGALVEPVTRTVREPGIGGGVLAVTMAGPDDTDSELPRMPRLRPGVHPLVVELQDAGRPVASFRTHLVRLPDEEPEDPLGVVVVAELTGPPVLQPDGSVLTRARDVAWVGAAAEALDGTSSLAVVPGAEILEGLADSGDAEAIAALEALGAAAGDHEVLAAPYVPLDEALWAAIGRPEVITELRDRAAASLGRTLGVDPVTSVAPVDRTAGDDTVAALQGLGFQALLVDRSSVVPAATGDADGTEVVDEDEAITAPLELGGPGAELPALAVDPSFVPEGGVSDDPVEAVVRSVAELAAVWFEATAGDADPPRHVVALGVEPVAVADGGILRPLLEQLAASPLLEPLTVTEALASAEPVDGWELVDAPSVPVGDLADRRAGLLGLVDSYESLLGRAQPLSTSLRERLDVAVADGLTLEQRERYLAAVEVAVQRGTQGIAIPEGQDFNLTSREAEIEVRVSNGLGVPANVAIEMEGDTRLQLVDGGRLQHVLEPGDNVVPVRVRARSTGRSEITITIRTADGGILLTEGTVGVRSTALTGVGIVLGVGAVAVLAVWWARQVRGSRRARRP